MENSIERSPGRREGDRKPHRMRKGMYILPSMFTAANMLLGYLRHYAGDPGDG